MDALTQAYALAQEWLFAQVVQPVLFHAGMGNLLEDGYAATGWLLVGLIELALIVTVMLPLQRLVPVEPVTDRRAVRVDILYTLIHRLGLFRVAMFFALDPVLSATFGWLQVHGIGGLQLDALWPGVSDLPMVSLLLYLVVFDLADYLLHRAQHRFEWWWALHAVHHSQRQMTVWSDNRNHLLDAMLRDVLMVTLARFIGVAPEQFIAIVALTQLFENLSHANARVHFGAWLNRLLVSPRFHRRHHAIGAADVPAGEGTPGGQNFGVLFSLWDQLFGTADFRAELPPTGILDQLPQAGARDYGAGFWAQQWLGMRRLFGRA